MLQASYLMLVEYNGEAKNVGTSELMIYNAMWSVPALVMVWLESISHDEQSVPECLVKLNTDEWSLLLLWKACA